MRDLIAQTAYSLLQPCGTVSGLEEVPRVISIMSSLLERLVARNELSVIDPHKLTIFHGLRAPSISVGKYLYRIFKYANCSPSCFVVAYAYIDRFIHQRSGVCITSLNVHRLLITSIMVAAKFMDDAYYNNTYYAKVGGISTMEMNGLELEFLFRLGFRLQITVSAFESYCLHLEREMALCEGFQVERPIIQYVSSLSGCSGHDKNQKQQHHHHQQVQTMTVWFSELNV